MKPSILWVTAFSPFPSSTGLQVASNNFISALTRNGVTVDLLILRYWDRPPVKSEIIEKLAVRNIKIIKPHSQLKIEHLIKKISYWFTGSILNFENNFKKEAAHQYIREGLDRWDAIIFEGILPAIICGKKGVYQKPDNFPILFYRAHNVESDLLYRAAKYFKSPLQKLNLFLQARRMQKAEASLIESAAYVLPISLHDENIFQRIYGKINSKWLPLAINFDDTNVSLIKNNRIELLFVGGLYWIPNRTGLHWFLKYVWPKILKLRSDIVLKVAGGFHSRWINKYKNLERVEFLGYVENLIPFYERCTATIAPIFYGSGIRVKILEAAKFGRACISTVTGIEGSCLSPASSCLLANNVDEWINILLNTTASEYQQIGRKAYEIVKYNYEANKVACDFLSILESTRHLSQSTR